MNVKGKLHSRWLFEKHRMDIIIMVTIYNTASLAVKHTPSLYLKRTLHVIIFHLIYSS